MIDKYAWNKQFRERVLALCVLPAWYVRFGAGIILPQYFDLESEQEICKAILEFYKLYGRPPYEDELEAHLHMVDGIADIIHTIYDLAINSDLTYASDNALQFAREQAMKIAILDSVDDLRAGDLAKPLERVKIAQAVGLDMTDIGLDMKANKIWAYAEALSDKIQTGIYHLDLLLEGGLSCGELGIVMASTNVGKTMMLVNIGCGAASIMGRANIVHITAEISAKKVAKRYAARTVFRWLKRESDPDEYIIAFDQSSSLRMPGNVIIKEYPSGSASVQDIDAYMERLRTLGMKADMLIVDYPDELRHVSVGEYRQNLGRTFSDLRALAAKFAIPVWGATQANRQALNKEMITLDSIAESYEKAQKSDVIIAMCQTTQEKEDGLLRLFGAKVRDGVGGWIIRCKLGVESHSIISEKIMTFAEIAQERERRSDNLKGRNA